MSGVCLPGLQNDSSLLHQLAILLATATVWILVLVPQNTGSVAGHGHFVLWCQDRRGGSPPLKAQKYKSAMDRRKALGESGAEVCVPTFLMNK